MNHSSGSATGGVRWLLRLEGLCVLLLALFFYHRLEGDWATFALFFLVPDLSLIAYFAGSRVGALAYNTAHSYIGAVLCLLCVSYFPQYPLTVAGLIWAAHIGFDRALGFGLKYAQGFSFTHLGSIGKMK